MSKKNLLIIGAITFVSAICLFSFKPANDPKKITLLRQYLSADADFGNMLIICYPDGKTKKQILLQSKQANNEMNDKMFAHHLNELIASGLEIKNTSTSGDSHLMITTYILE